MPGVTRRTAIAMPLVGLSTLWLHPARAFADDAQKFIQCGVKGRAGAWSYDVSGTEQCQFHSNPVSVDLPGKDYFRSGDGSYFDIILTANPKGDKILLDTPSMRPEGLPAELSPARYSIVVDGTELWASEPRWNSPSFWGEHLNPKTPEIVAAMRSGKTLDTVVAGSDGKPVAISHYSLDGFKDAEAAWLKAKDALGAELAAGAKCAGSDDPWGGIFGD